LLSGGNQIIKIDNEIMNTSYATTTGLGVLARGDNGSTAATHDDASTIYVWNNMSDIKRLTLEIVNMMYRARYGESAEATSTVTAAGILITPQSLPLRAKIIVDKYKRRVW
jgi:hypothetical protein